MYSSGSIAYTNGAQALALIPLSFAGLLRAKRVWQRWPFALLLLLSSYMAMISGARAVYLPLVLVALVLIVRLVAEGKRWWLVLSSVALLSLALVGVDYLVPTQPMMTALGRKASVGKQLQSSSDQGAFTHRLRFWDQTFDIALVHPLGSGNGSYQAVIHTYQKYPMSWANSPHNYFVETVATGGWIRLALLLAVVVVPIWRAWRSKHWPWALAAAGLWATLAFDVTSLYPSFMMYAFMLLGVTHFATRPEPKKVDKLGPAWLGQPRALAGVVSVVAAVGLALWWYAPCSDLSCATDRYLGVDFKVLPALQQASPTERVALIKRTRELYPESVWVLGAEKMYADSPSERLRITREIATRFPYQHPQNYLDWANAALAMDMPGEAAEALRQGLAIFPEDKYPYGERRMTPEAYAAWIAEAERELAELERASE